MNHDSLDPRAVRRALLSSLPEHTDVSSSEAPRPQFVYVPELHKKTLHPQNPLIQGIRGAGKSLWWAALQSESHRRLIGRALADIGVDEKTLVRPGFGAAPQPDCYPDSDTLVHLLKAHDARQIWRTVMYCSVVESPAGSWSARVQWVVSHPEDVATELQRKDRELFNRHQVQLVLFDALDRTAHSWTDLRKLLRGLLQVLLEFRSFRAIRTKAFVRPDMLEDAEVARFPDASKIIANAVDLLWTRLELYNLLWQYLANAPEGAEEFRQSCDAFKCERIPKVGEVWFATGRLKNEEDQQRSLFHAIAGPYMGTEKRRGYPYTWLPNHLGDAHGQVSPRSFLAALRTAAEGTPTDFKFGLYYEAIKQGVQKASTIRVEEIKEDAPWVQTALEPLTRQRISLPCERTRIVEIWEDANALQGLEDQVEAAGGHVGPRRLSEGSDGLILDLCDLGVFEPMRDGRVNMPDVYRVGFGLGRRGGVRPVR